MSQEKIEFLRFFACVQRPYLSDILWNLTPVRRENFPTFAADQWFRLYYGDEVFTTWTRDEQCGMLFTLVYRLALNHYGRAKQVNAMPNIWQLASALESHSMVSGDRMQLPDGAILPRDFGLPAGWPVEHYYDALMQLAGQKNKKGQQVPEPSNDPQEGPPSPQDGTAGSCADGQPKEWEDGKPSGKKDGDSDRDGTGAGNAQAHGVQEHEAEILRQMTANKAKSRGDVPLGMRRYAENLLDPKADWRHELRALIRGSVSTPHGWDDYAYNRPARRSPRSGCILPSMISQAVNIAVVIDTSGSMSTRELEQGVSEVAAILRDLACNGLTVLTVDAVTQVAQKVFRHDQIVLKGGGGTDMRVGIADALKQKPTPDVVIVVTDGETPWPEEEPRAKIVAALTQKPRDHMPLWIKQVIIEPDTQ